MSKINSRLPRNIDAASVDEGDTIQVTRELLDLTIHVTGKVHRIVENGLQKIFITKAGQEIVHTTVTGKCKITLLERDAAMQLETLFEMEGA